MNTSPSTPPEGIDEPGLYQMSDEAYQADCCKELSLRSSYIAKLLEKGKTPAHLAHEISRLNPNYERKEQRYFNIGKACHTLVLGRGSLIEPIAGYDYATNEKDGLKMSEKKALRDKAYDDHRIPLLIPEQKQVRAMAKAAERQIDELLEADAIPLNPFDGAYSEQVIVWRDPQTGVMCRAMLDGLAISEDFLGEYKTDAISAAPENFPWRARKLNYISRLAFYRRGLEALKMSYSPTIGIFVQESIEPYLMAYHRISDEMIMRADRDVTTAMKIWRKCRDTGKWDGYSPLGYDLDLTEREQQEELGQRPAAGAAAPHGGHINSEDIDYAPVKYVD